MTRLRSNALDAILAAVGLAFGAVSLAYPFGRDQAVAWYVGREWLTYFRIPYRDAVAVEAPGMFLLHGSLIRVFGEGAWPIRLFDLAMMSALAAACAALATPASGRLPRGLLGLAFLLVMVLYYGFFPYWDTAQADGVAVSLVVMALAMARRGRVMAGGVLLGAALVVKPALATFVPAALVVLGGGPRAWVRLLAGVLLPPLLLVGYFALYGAVDDLYEWVVRAHLYSLEHEEARPAGWVDLLLRSRSLLLLFAPISGALLAGALIDILRAALTRDRAALARYREIAALLVAAYLAVLVQLTFYRHHAVAFLPALALLSLTLVTRLLQALTPRWHPGAVVLGAACALGLLYTGSFPRDVWWSAAAGRLAVARGRRTPVQYLRIFDLPVLDYASEDTEAVGRWLRAHTRPEDNVAVRGFEPQLYAAARRHTHGRFFWTNMAVDRERALRFEDWYREELRQMETDPPLVVVTPFEEGDLVGACWFEGGGFIRVERFGAFIVLLRPDVRLPP